MSDEVVFPDTIPEIDFTRDWITFPALLGSRRLTCVVSYELLWERFGLRGTSSEELESVYKANKDKLRDIARSLIRAGRITATGEVRLTTEAFALRDVAFGTKLRQARDLFQLARQATGWLEDLIGPSADTVGAEWDRREDSAGNAVVILRLADESGWVTDVFSPRELESPARAVAHLRRLWGELLQIRSEKQLQALTAVEVE